MYTNNRMYTEFTLIKISNHWYICLIWFWLPCILLINMRLLPPKFTYERTISRMNLSSWGTHSEKYGFLKIANRKKTSSLNEIFSFHFVFHIINMELGKTVFCLKPFICFSGQIRRDQFMWIWNKAELQNSEKKYEYKKNTENFYIMI